MVIEPTDEILKLRRRTWRKNKIDRLKEGMTFLPSGRDATLYFRRGNRIIDLGLELSADKAFDLIVWTKGLEHWIDPETLELSPTTAVERDELHAEVEKWFKSRGWRADWG